MLHENIGINENHHLTFAGMDTVQLAQKYGTPLYLLDEERVRSRCKTYVDAVQSFFGEDSRVLFASKALSFKEIYRIIKEENMCCDVVSPGELFTAAAAGFPMEKAYFHGNNKTDADIAFAMENKIGYFIADNRVELEQIDAEAKRRNIIQNVLLRITPGIDPHTHQAINTGKVDSKFGVAIETGQAMALVKYALSLENVGLCGFHCHIGSQIFDIKPYFDAAEMMLKFIRDVCDTTSYSGNLLNLGGGFGVRYVSSDPCIDYRENIRHLAERMKKICGELSMPMPVVLLEPGRSIVADAGMTLYTVGTTKTIPGFKNYVSIDGGMCDNPRYALYQSQYTVYLADRADAESDFTCTVAGRCCESGDLIQEGIRIPYPKRGDTLAVAVTGAYNYAMASNYNRIPRPPVVLLHHGESRIAVKRESYENLCCLDN